MTLSKEQMMSMPAFFADVDDPRRREGRRHTLPSVLGLALAATLAGARGYKAISEWVKDLSPKVLAYFGVRFRDGTRIPPSRTVIRDVLVRVDPQQIDEALRAWTAANGGTDSALAIDGKTMRGAVDEDGRQTHVLGIVGHDTGAHHGKKKSA